MDLPKLCDSQVNTLSFIFLAFPRVPKKLFEFKNVKMFIREGLVSIEKGNRLHLVETPEMLLLLSFSPGHKMTQDEIVAKGITEFEDHPWICKHVDPDNLPPEETFETWHKFQLAKLLGDKAIIGTEGEVRVLKDEDYEWVSQTISEYMDREMPKQG